MNRLHLTDSQLIDACLSHETAGNPERAHLDACPACAQRQDTLADLLDEVSAAATLEADAAFPEERLARQQARILQRLDQDGRPARVIAFPAHQSPARPLRLHSSPARWIAAVAVAAFVIGLFAGQHLPHMRRPVATAVAGITVQTPRSTGTASNAVSDDELLGEIEALGDNGPLALRRIDVLTPRAWDTQ